MKISTISQNKKTIHFLLAVAFWLAVWQGVSMLLGQEILLASPIQTAQIFAQLVLQSVFWQSVAVTTLRIISGFCIAVVIGTILAVLSKNIKPVKILLAPIMSAIKAAPVVSFIILALIWVSSESLSVLISFLTVLPIIYHNISEGLSSESKNLDEMSDVFRLSRAKKFKLIRLPILVPHLNTAARISASLAFKSGIAAEVIGLPGGTIGEKLYTAKLYLETGEVLCWTAVIIIIAAIFEKLLLKMIAIIKI